MLSSCPITCHIELEHFKLNTFVNFTECTSIFPFWNLTLLEINHPVTNSILTHMWWSHLFTGIQLWSHYNCRKLVFWTLTFRQKTTDCWLLYPSSILFSFLIISSSGSHFLIVCLLGYPSIFEAPLLLSFL